jgi:hypothetical protein
MSPPYRKRAVADECILVTVPTRPAAALAAYLSFAEMCEATYGREIFPIGHLAKK